MLHLRNPFRPGRGRTIPSRVAALGFLLSGLVAVASTGWWLASGAGHGRADPEVPAASPLSNNQLAPPQGPLPGLYRDVAPDLEGLTAGEAEKYRAVALAAPEIQQFLAGGEWSLFSARPYDPGPPKDPSEGGDDPCKMRCVWLGFYRWDGQVLAVLVDRDRSQVVTSVREAAVPPPPASLLAEAGRLALANKLAFSAAGGQAEAMVGGAAHWIAPSGPCAVELCAMVPLLRKSRLGQGTGSGVVSVGVRLKTGEVLFIQDADPSRGQPVVILNKIMGE